MRHVHGRVGVPRCGGWWTMPSCSPLRDQANDVDGACRAAARPSPWDVDILKRGIADNRQPTPAGRRRNATNLRLKPVWPTRETTEEPQVTQDQHGTRGEMLHPPYLDGPRAGDHIASGRPEAQPSQRNLADCPRWPPACSRLRRVHDKAAQRVSLPRRFRRSGRKRPCVSAAGQSSQGFRGNGLDEGGHEAQARTPQPVRSELAEQPWNRAASDTRRIRVSASRADTGRTGSGLAVYDGLISDMLVTLIEGA